MSSALKSARDEHERFRKSVCKATFRRFSEAIGYWFNERSRVANGEMKDDYFAAVADDKRTDARWRFSVSPVGTHDAQLGVC